MAVKKKNIILPAKPETLAYKSQGKPIPKSLPERGSKHAAFLMRQLKKAYRQQQRKRSQAEVAAIKYREGTYLEFTGTEQLIIKQLENIPSKVRLLNVRTEEKTERKKRITTNKATVYIPAGKEPVFLKSLSEFAEKLTEKGNRSHEDLYRCIDDIKLALLDAFWTGDKKDQPKRAAVWCEIWLRVDGGLPKEKKEQDKPYNHVQKDFMALCDQLGIEYNQSNLHFPERLVTLICANAAGLKKLIEHCDYIAEIRRAPVLTSFFTNLPVKQQQEWITALIPLLEYNFTDTSVCILDTGVNHGHQLLREACDDKTIQTVVPDWGTHDHAGHGTEMAGIALFHNLEERLASNMPTQVVHRLESVKILPPRRKQTPPELYGDYTKSAVALAEIEQPKYNRAICMAVTSSEFNTGDGSPTSWSGAVDSIVAGTDDSRVKRLFFVSAGNMPPENMKSISYPTAQEQYSVESPGQAWNAITVGAYNSKITVDDVDLKGWRSVAGSDTLSPFSSTSRYWDAKWPIKPEILCEGGNVITDGRDYLTHDDLSLLTTSHKALYSHINGTSSATAQAAWMAAQIMAEYPNIWSETVRALMIHSARWPEKMKRQFCEDDTKKGQLSNLLRCCGYGKPDLDIAIQCMNNSVNLIIQAELQPYEQSKMKEMHIHQIPWPEKYLLSLGALPVEMRVTLSYFIEPSPSEVGWKNRYRYPSCGLRFDTMKAGEEEKDAFIKRVNLAMRDEDEEDYTGESGRCSDWLLGESIFVGSIHSDVLNRTAADLCKTNCIAVYPVIGWWRERPHLKCYNKKIRYALIVSLSTKKKDVELYAEIMKAIEIATEVQVKTETEISISPKRDS